jgi:DNA-binding CsgD family transcriptional regulator
MRLLTGRQCEVLALLGDGMTRAAVADRLCISVGTVDTTMSIIFAKLQVRSLYSALRAAEEAGLLDSGQERFAVPAPSRSFTLEAPCGIYWPPIPACEQTAIAIEGDD